MNVYQIICIVIPALGLFLIPGLLAICASMRSAQISNQLGEE